MRLRPYPVPSVTYARTLTASQGRTCTSTMSAYTRCEQPTKSWKSVREVLCRPCCDPPAIGTPPVKSAGEVARYTGGQPAEADEELRRCSTVLRLFTAPR